VFIESVRFVLAELTGLGVDRAGTVVVGARIGACALCLIGAACRDGPVFARLRGLFRRFGLGSAGVRSLPIGRRTGALGLHGSLPGLAPQLSRLVGARVEAPAPGRSRNYRDQRHEYDCANHNYDNRSSAHVSPSNSFR
jgi:hypothetical protein